MNGTGITISDHAYSRYIERTGAQEKYQRKIINVIEQGREVRPVNGFMKLLRNDFKEARYYHYNNLVAVVSCDSNKVVTVMEYVKGKWER